MITYHFAVAGYLLDVTHDPNAPYYVYGTVQIVGGIIFALIPAVKKRLEKDQAVKSVVEMSVPNQQ